MLTPPKKQQYELVPAANHVARLYEIIHIGTIQTHGQYGEKMQDKIRMTFELCNEKKVFKEGDEAKPFSISREFTYTFGAKGLLRPFIDGMTGTKMHDDEFPDLEALLGSACLLNVVHVANDGVTYANIQNASPLPKGMEAPAIVNKPRAIDINSIPFDELDKLPEFIQKKMKSSEEYVGRVQHSGSMAGVSDENRQPVPGASEPGKLQKPRVLGGPGNSDIQYPEADINPDDIPF
jgi:hypothetical protein